MTNKERLAGIYSVTSPSGKVYIGQSVNIYSRFYNYKKLHCKEQRHLYYSLKKYGSENHLFEIIELCKDIELDFNELFYIAYFKYLGFEMLNLTEGGDSGKMSKESLLISKKNRANSIKNKLYRLEAMTEIDKFKRELLLRKYAQNSIDTYTSLLGVLIDRTKLDVQKVKDYLCAIKNRSYHKQLVATYRNYCAFVLKAPVSLNDIPYPRKEERLPEVLSVGEIKKLIEYPKNLKHQAIICLLYNCGLRVSELINLKMSQIDRKRGVITIRGAKQNKDRQVPLSDDLSGLLVKYYQHYRPDTYLFNGQQGLLYTESSVNQLLKYWAKKAGINKRIHAHKLRHCFATHLHEAGTDLSIIQKLLGHSDIKTTDIYTKVSTAYVNRVQSLITNMNLNK